MDLNKQRSDKLARCQIQSNFCQNLSYDTFFPMVGDDRILFTVCVWGVSQYCYLALKENETVSCMH